MADRTTKELTTPCGHVVVVYDYITAAEVHDIMKKAPKADGPVADRIKSSNDGMLTVIRSIDGSSEEILAQLLALPFPDYTFLSQEVEQMIDPEKKLQPQSAPTSPAQ